MIFKTFDSDIDKWTAKIGIFGKSFNELGTAVNDAFKSVIDNIDNFDEDIGFWESLKNNLFSNENDKDWIKNSLDEIVSQKNIDSYINELNLDSAKGKLKDIFDWEKLVKQNQKSWQDYFNTLDDGEDYIKNIIKNTEDLSKLEGQDLVDACNEARETIINQNHELQNMSFSAKAGKIALQGLATVGNMVLFAFISKGIELFVSWIDKLVHSSEYAQKAVQAATDNAKSFSQAIKDIQKNTVDMETGVNSIAKRYAELSQGVNPFTNENKSLPTDEYEEFLDLNEQLTGLFPSLTRNYDENGNAILGLSGSVDSVTESIKALVEQEKELSKAKIRENIEKYFDGTDEADGAWKALEGRKEALEHANKELEELTNTYYGLINSDEKINIGRFHKNFVKAEKKEYLNYIKDNFGEDIADAVEQVTSIHLGMGLNNQSADLIVDFSKLELTETQKEQIVRSYDTFYSDLIAKQKTAMSEFDSQNSEFSNNAMLWLEDLSFYKDSDKYIQTAVQNLVRSIDWSNYTPEELDYDGVKRILQDSILTPFQTACDNPDTKEKLNGALTGLFTMDTTDMPAADITSQVNSYIDTIATAISNDNPTELKVRLGFGDTDDAVRRLQNSIRTITDDHGQSDREEYAALSEFTQNLTQAQIELWLKSTQGAENAAEAVQMYKDGLKKHTFSLTETQSQSIDEFQSKVKTLSDTLAALNSGTFSQADMTDLLQEFPRLAGETDNLQNAIQELINTLLYDLYAALGADIPQELKDSLRAIADEAGRTSSEIKTVADAISDVSSLHSVMQSFSEELSSGTISADTLGNIATKYPQLEDAVNAYCMGLITEQELYGQLSEQYDNACQAFQAANRAKIYENQLFYQNALETHDELVENLKNTYQIDFKNFTSLEVAKKEAELKLIGELSNMWYKYYDIVMGADGLYKVQSTGFGESYDEQNSQIYQDMSDKADEMQTFLDDLNNAFGLKDLFENNNSLKGSLLDPSATPSTQTKETFNWIERAIKRVQEALARLTKIRDNTFKTWGERNGALQSEIAATTHELQLQAQAHYKYLELAAAVPLDDYHKALVQSGDISLETVTDSNLKELISEYEDFYQKAVDAYDAVEDLQKTLSQLAKTRFDSVLSQFNNELSLIESRKELLDNSISDMETRGYAVSAKLYEELALSESGNLSKIRTERDALLKSLNDAVTDGSIQAYSEEWYNMAGTINDVTAAMQKSQTQLTQYQNTLKELNWENFDNLQKTIGRIVNESDFMIDLLENETLTSGTGTFTDEGLATVGLHAVNYNTFMAQADRYAEKLRELQKELANDPYNQTLIDKERELAEAQRDSILSAEQEKQAMISLSRNVIQEQINALEKLIDKKKESFNTEKDLYEFQKTIAEKTKAVTDIKKQLSVAKLDTSEEGKQRLLELQNRLKNAEDDLKDTQYDRWIKEQETLLDNMMTEYETLQNELSENTDLLIKDLISMTNENASAISDTIRTKTDELGITLTEELETIFNGEGSVKNIVSIYSDNFNSHMTTLQGVLNGIEQKNTEMIVAIDNLGISFITAINTAAGMFNTSQNPSQPLPGNGGLDAFNQTPAVAPSNPAQGQRVDSASGIWYASSAGSNPSGNVNHFAPDYFIVDRINPNSPYPYHIQAYINGKAAGGSGWVKASQIGYKDGLKNAKTAHLAWTQEDGGELIYRKSDHALFTPIGAGDAVFTRQMSDNLWNLAKGTYSVPEPQTRSLGASQKGDVIISIDKMNLPDVTNPQQFASRFVDTLKNDSKVQSAIRSVSVDLLAGRPKSKVNTF